MKKSELKQLIQEELRALDGGILDYRRTTPFQSEDEWRAKWTRATEHGGLPKQVALKTSRPVTEEETILKEFHQDDVQSVAFGLWLGLDFKPDKTYRDELQKIAKAHTAEIIGKGIYLFWNDPKGAACAAKFARDNYLI